MTRWATPAGLLLLAAVAAFGVEVREPLRPSVEGFEEAVQEQLLGVRQRLDDLLAREDVPAAAVGDALGGMGQLYFLYDLFEAAADCFREAARLLPDDFRWPYYLGVIAADGTDLAAAAGHFERAAELAPDDLPTRLRLAGVLLDAGDLDGAQRWFEAALGLDEESAAAHHGLGRIAFARRDYEEAADRFENVLELQPSAVSVNHLLGMAYRQLGEEELARAHLGISAEGPVLFGDPLVNQLSDLVASARIHGERGIELMQQGEIRAGIEELRATVARAPDDHLAHHNLAIGLTRAGEQDEAKEVYRKAIELNPDYPASHFNLGLLLGWEGDYAGATEHLGRAHALDPENAGFAIEWGKALALEGRFDEARAAFEELVRTAPPGERWRASLRLGDVLVRLGEPEAAEAAWRRLIDEDAPARGRAEAWTSLARLAESRGDREEALERFGRAVELAPEVLTHRIDLARAQARAGDFTAAATTFDAALEIDPDDVESHFGRGLALMMAGELARARDGLLASIDRLGAEARVIELTAQLLSGSPDPALRDGVRAETLLRRVPPEEATVQLIETMAMALAAQGLFDEARGLQGDLARQAGDRGAELARRLEARVALYAAGEICVAPWLDGGRCRTSR